MMTLLCFVLLYLANSCGPTQVANSDYSTSSSITGSTGDTVAVTCDDGYSGGGTTTCETTGVFSSILCEGTAYNRILDNN